MATVRMFLVSSSLALVALASSPVAQRPTEGSLPSRAGTVPVAGVVTGVDNPEIPAPPRALQPSLPKHGIPQPRLVPGAAPELPPGPATTPGVPGAVAPAADALVLIENSSVAPAGSSRSHTSEPSTVINRDVAFYTANWFAGLSQDSGRTWTHISPYTKFPASDGGFCCDQLTLYVPPPHDITIWVLQYSYSSTTASGRQRVAVARGRDGLASQTFHYYDVAPQLAGFASGTWYDFPHVAASNGFLFLASNVYDPASRFQGSSVFRLNLADVGAGRGAAFHVVTGGNTIFDSASHRLASGCTTTMYYGGHQSTIFGAPIIRIFAWDDASPTVQWFDRGVSGWSGGVSSAIGPDGRDWLGMDDHRIGGAYFAQGAVSFLWGSNAGGSFPRPFVRIAGFAPAQNYNLVGEASIWNPTMAWAYPCAAVNSRQDIGGTIAFGGGSFTPGTAAFVVDAQSGWAPLTNAAFATGARGPNTNRWGDYHTASPHAQHPTTYVGAGFSIDAAGAAQPRFAWFGRQGDSPTMATLNVISTPAAGIPVTVDRLDRNGQQNGTTNFTRTYAPYQGMTWNAPTTWVVNSANYVFDRWVWNGTPQPPGVRDLVINSLGGVTSHTLEARYIPLRVLLVDSVNPTLGVPITATRDYQGNTGGNTSFNLFYLDGTRYTLTAPSSFNGAPIDRWLVDGVPQAANAATITWTGRNDHRFTVRYKTPTCGSFTAYGTSCNGSSRFGHTAWTARGACGPWVGDTVDFALSRGHSFGLGYLVLGLSNRSWLGLPLPLQIPAYPGCWVYTDNVTNVPVALDLLGNGVVSVTIPGDASLVGAHVYSQYVSVGSTSGPMFSYAIDTAIGGYTP